MKFSRWLAAALVLLPLGGVAITGAGIAAQPDEVTVYFNPD